MTIKQLSLKTSHRVENKPMSKGGFSKILMAFVFFRRMCRNNIYTVQVCRQVMDELKGDGVNKVIFYGAGAVSRILYILAKENKLEVEDIHDSSLMGRRFLNFQVKADDSLRGYEGKVIVTFLTHINEKIKRLQALGIPRSNIIRLQ